MSVRLEFHGAAGTVTGSKFLLTVRDTRILVDCGMFQGLKALRLKNWEPPAFNPKQLDAVLLTHAHVDHSGYLPRLVREGYRGRILCTPATADVAAVLLMDAARLQEEDAEYAARKGFSKHRPPLPLYTEADATRAIGRFQRVEFDRAVSVGDARVQFRIAGHILGSSWIRLEFQHGGRAHRLVFSGDLGRPAMPVIADPEPLDGCDTLVLESTYGDRRHDHRPLDDQLAEAMLPTLERRGTVLIPAFAVGRSQTMLHLIRELIAAGRLPPVPVHLDSPMAVEVTRLYARYRGTDELDGDWASPDNRVPVQLHSTVMESKRLNEAAGPRIIVSSSGMLAGGRVLHHLARLAPQPENLILLPGYQAVGTRGRTLAEGGRIVRVHGRDVAVRAQVAQLEGFSAHADMDELVAWTRASEPAPRTIFLVHGESESVDHLATTLQATGLNPLAPAQGDTFVMDETGAWNLQKPAVR